MLVPPHLRVVFAAAIATSVAGIPGPRAQEAPWAPPTAEQVAARERIRPEVEAIFGELRTPPADPVPRSRGPLAVQKLVAIGPLVAPFLESEIDLPDPSTFNVAAAALGLLDTPGAAEALRRADERADHEGGGFGLERRSVALLGLACAGEPDAVTRALSGRIDLSAYELAPDIPLLELVSLLSYPGSYDALVAQLDARTAPEAADRRNLSRVVAALGALLDPRAVAKLVPLAGDKDPSVRREVARALGRVGDASAAETVIAMVRDPDRLVARAAAGAVARIRPVERAGTVVALLDLVEDTEVRVDLYDAVQGMLGPKAFDHLVRHAGRPEFIDRAHWVRAVAATKDRRAIASARAALADTDAEVTYAAMEALAALGGEGAFDSLLAVAGTRPWPLAKPAIDLLVEHGDARVAPRVAERLSREILSRPLTDARLVTPMEQMLDVLVEFGFTDPAASLRKSAADQPDGAVAAALRSAADDLERIRELGVDPARWAPLLDSADREMQRLAVRRLARIGGPAACAILEKRFATAAPDLREAIVVGLARRPQPEAAGLFERVLDDPALDDLETTPLRAAAAWGARRIGGARMAEALARSAVRTGGIDLPTLVYWVQLSGKGALPPLERLRLQRLRTFSAHRFEEQQFVDELVTDLRAGRSTAGLDLPPEALHRH